MHHTVIFGMSSSTIFFHIISQTAWFFKKRYWIYNECFNLLCYFVWNISHYKNWVRFDKKKKYIGLHVKYPLFLSDFKGTWIFSINFQNIHIKFHENRFVPCGQTDSQTDMMTLIDTFHNFVNAPKKNCHNREVIQERGHASQKC